MCGNNKYQVTRLLLSIKNFMNTNAKIIAQDNYNLSSHNVKNILIYSILHLFLHDNCYRVVIRKLSVVSKVSDDILFSSGFTLKSIHLFEL